MGIVLALESLEAAGTAEVFLGFRVGVFMI